MQGFSVLKNPIANAGDSDLIPGSGRSPEEEKNGSILPRKFCEQRSLAGYIMGSQE